MTRLIHPSIIEILAYSNDHPPNACLVYPYLKNGNLEDRLQLRPLRGEDAPTACLTVEQRTVCAVKIAEGLVFLHNQPKPLIHRDIKTSNILLDNSMQPKVGAVYL